MECFVDDYLLQTVWRTASEIMEAAGKQNIGKREYYTLMKKAKEQGLIEEKVEHRYHLFRKCGGTADPAC